MKHAEDFAPSGERTHGNTHTEIELIKELVRNDAEGYVREEEQTG